MTVTPMYNSFFHLNISGSVISSSAVNNENGDRNAGHSIYDFNIPGINITVTIDQDGDRNANIWVSHWFQLFIHH